MKIYLIHRILLLVDLEFKEINQNLFIKVNNFYLEKR
jgi:hypothetical protein